VLFDLTGLFRQPPKIDRTALETKLQARLAQLTVRFEMFQVRVTKEVWRQHPLDAAYFYQSLTRAPLTAQKSPRSRPRPPLGSANSPTG
jgi:hypothetical protein